MYAVEKMNIIHHMPPKLDVISIPTSGSSKSSATGLMEAINP